MSYKLLFAIAAAHDLKIKQIDVKTAFLYGDINTKIYVEQPKGMGAIGESYKVCKLNKALYGLKQSPRVWYFTLTTYLKTLSFEPLTADNYVFHNSKGIYIAIFVNNLLIIGPSGANISMIKTSVPNNRIGPANRTIRNPESEPIGLQSDCSDHNPDCLDSIAIVNRDCRILCRPRNSLK